jgi:hypothetical protein
MVKYVRPVTVGAQDETAMIAKNAIGDLYPLISHHPFRGNLFMLFAGADMAILGCAVGAIEIHLQATIHAHNTKHHSTINCPQHQ